MEPRIATLLGSVSLDRPTLHLLHDPTPRRPHPVEPTTANDDVHTAPTTAGSSLLDQNHNNESPSQPKRQKPSAPIASVLNRETVHPISTASVTPFSGRLSDLLLDPSQQHTNKRKRVEEPVESQAPSIGSENPLLKLPKLPQQPKKTTKRPRIPPLLQGLHQPPAFAQSRLYPPITSDTGAFGRDIADGVGMRNMSGGPQLRKEISKESLIDAPPDIELEQPATEVVEERVGEKAGPVSATSDKENRNSDDRPDVSVQATATKGLKKRNKWSDQETKDLLVGVSRFGIGNWKKILQCPDYKFNQRTAVDLKDRFRTCCPGEGLKARKQQRKGDTSDSNPPGSATSALSKPNRQDRVVQEAVREINLKQLHDGEHSKDLTNVPNPGLKSIFAKSKRRERRAFTEQDDENLLKGFAKYNSQWHLIRDDLSLSLNSRQSTDLRDRFRIRYPEKFAKAGYKVKPKDEMMLKEKQRESEKEKHSSQEREREKARKEEREREEMQKRTGGFQEPSKSIESSPQASKTKESITDHALTSLVSTASFSASLVQPARTPFLASKGGLDDFDFLSEEDVDSSHSPIILNRNIFEWADANPSNMSAAGAHGLSSMGTLTVDAPANVFHGTDGVHINPMMTLNLPMALINSNTLSIMPSQPSASNQPTSSRLLEPFQPASSMQSNAASLTPTSKSSSNHLLRTPNLPTIVFPHVPASSARSAVHNLPPPADLLSGLDLDPPYETQASSFSFDDSLVLGLPTGTNAMYTSSSTLAPIGGGTSGRGMLTLEKGLLEDLDRRA